jgi:hypothetical protein
MLFIVPMHLLTHELLLFATGIWTANIHDNIDGRWLACSCLELVPPTRPSRAAAAQLAVRVWYFASSAHMAWRQLLTSGTSCISEVPYDEPAFVM